MNRLTVISIVIFALSILISITIFKDENFDVKHINDEFGETPPSAGVGLLSSQSNRDSTLGTAGSGSSSGLKFTRKVLKETSEAGVVTYSDAPRSKVYSTDENKTTKDMAASEPEPAEETVVSSPKVKEEVVTISTSLTPPSQVKPSSPNLFSYPSRWANQFSMLPQDTDGWTVIKPAVDTRFIYVSNLDGNDGAARAYTKRTISDPFSPPAAVIPFKTIDAALKLQRGGYSDWILLKKGDEWDISKSISLSSGRSVEEPLVITSYGPSTDRPLIKTGQSGAINLVQGQSFIAVIGIEFYAQKRDPASIDFVGWNSVASPVGFRSISNKSATRSITLEDNVFRYFAGNVVFSGNLTQKNIIIRRNQLLNAYSIAGHSQGLYTNKTKMLLEENLLDHNGWYQQNYERMNNTAKGQATFFNHNMYLANAVDTVIVGNLITRASSMGLKLSANPNNGNKQNVIMAENVTIIDNLFLEGEIAISAGGNTDFNNGYRFKNMTIKGNVMMHIGDTQPLRRTFGMGLETLDWDTGIIANNYFLYSDNPSMRNLHGIDIKGLVRNVTVSNNVLKGIKVNSDKFILTFDDEKKTGLNIMNNNVLNTYLSSRRDLTSYLSINRNTNGVEKLVQKAKLQSKDNWTPKYQAYKINQYLMN